MLVVKKHIFIGVGVVDGDYGGDVAVTLVSHSGEDLKINMGDRITHPTLEWTKALIIKEVQELD